LSIVTPFHLRLLLRQTGKGDEMKVSLGGYRRLNESLIFSCDFPDFPIG